jgi:4-hydroxy-4-methyl-2-oxoglutarate aldolase
MNFALYDVCDMPQQIASAAIARLRLVETATVGHFRMHGFMNNALGPIQQGVRVAGTAVTVRTSGVDSTAILLALDALRPGDLLVVDRGGEDRHACFGAVTAAVAHKAGALGVIIDGRACDFQDIRTQGLPLWCRGPSPILGRRLDLGGAVNVPISCGGVSVCPGDAILADDSGILVLSSMELEAVATEALDRQSREVTLLQRIDGGETLADIVGSPRFQDYLKR